MHLLKALRRANSDADGCSWIVALGFVAGVFYEIQTWFINADVATKRLSYEYNVEADTRRWLDDSKNFIINFASERQTLDQLIESTASKYAPLLNNTYGKLTLAEKDLEIRISELEDTLELLGRDLSSDDQLIQWKALLTGIQNNITETEELRKNLYLADQKALLTPNSTKVLEELDVLISYVSSSAKKTEIELKNAIEDI
jgi:hypothetical protein